jgi:hypothetical protein
MSTLTVLNFSGGKQSSCLLWLVLKGVIPKPDNFLVLNADPGMENSKTYEYVERMFGLCRAAGIDCAKVPGPNLYLDLVQLEVSGATRADNPPYWTKDETGKVGQLMQKCTKHYKIAPMDRFLRIYMENHFGISAKSKRIPEDFVEKWIGFSADEESRCKPSRQGYIKFRYPLIEHGITNADVLEIFKELGEEPPPRSVCNACFANGSDVLFDMKMNRSKDWEQACQVDDAVRDLTQIGINDEVYVSRACRPLREFDERVDGGYEGNGDEWACDGGYCFV